MPKNTKLLAIALAAFAILLIVVNVRNSFTGTPETPPANAPSPTTAPIRELPYTSRDCRVSLTYPSNLTVIESTESATIFMDEKSPANSVLLGCKTSIPRSAFQGDTSEHMVLHYAAGSATISGTLYHGTASPSGKPADALIFIHPKTGLSVLVTGFGGIFQKITSSLRIQ